MAISVSLQSANKPGFPTQFTYNDQEWTKVKLCGEGTFSKCFQIRNKGGQNLAVKIYKTGAKYEYAFQNEVKMLSLMKINSRSGLAFYIVDCIDIFNTISGEKCIVMELLGCSLKDLVIKHEMKGFSLYLVKKLLHNLLSGVMFLEEMDIVHGDIKPSNILWNMNSECFQLIDFSLSFKSGMKPAQPLQSPGYQAPEVLQWNANIKGNSLHNNDAHFDTLTDIWSIGCVLFYGITGQQLYSVEHAQQLALVCTNCKSKCGHCLHSTRATHLIISSRNELDLIHTENLTHIISRVLQCHPSNRFRPSDVLKHPFLVAGAMLQASIMDLLLLPTRVLRLLNMFDEENLESIEDIKLDIQGECEKFGEVVSLKINRKINAGHNVYIQYKYAENCCIAQSSLSGRSFDNRCVVATFFPWQLFRDDNFY